MSLNGHLFLGRSLNRPCGRVPPAAALATNVLGEGSFFYAAMNSRLFESLEGSRLSVCQPRFGVALGESPMTAIGPNQQELDPGAAKPVANCGDLFASTESAKLRQAKEFYKRSMRLRPGQTSHSVTRNASAHSSRVHDAVRF